MINAFFRALFVINFTEYFHSSEHVQELILGGDDAEIGAWPWLAAIYVATDQGFLFTCGGTFVLKS